MFYCDKCAKKKGWEENTVIKSYGACEVCGRLALCNDKPSKYLKPIKKGG